LLLRIEEDDRVAAAFKQKAEHRLSVAGVGPGGITPLVALSILGRRATHAAYHQDSIHARTRHLAPPSGLDRLARTSESLRPSFEGFSQESQ
jgi:hypothetical protein